MIDIEWKEVDRNHLGYDLRLKYSHYHCSILYRNIAKDKPFRVCPASPCCSTQDVDTLEEAKVLGLKMMRQSMRFEIDRKHTELQIYYDFLDALHINALVFHQPTPERGTAEVLEPGMPWNRVRWNIVARIYYAADAALPYRITNTHFKAEVETLEEAHAACLEAIKEALRAHIRALQKNIITLNRFFIVRSYRGMRLSDEQKQQLSDSLIEWEKRHEGILL